MRRREFSIQTPTADNINHIIYLVREDKSDTGRRFNNCFHPIFNGQRDHNIIANT